MGGRDQPPAHRPLALMRALTLVSILVVIASCVAGADETPFDGGWMRCAWSADGQSLTVQAAVDARPEDSGSSVWVLTAYSHRFEDGVFGWQIHVGGGADSILVLPNDFLTARLFTMEQLGIELQLADAGSELSLRFPAAGVIPRLVAPGDQLELHALWVQQPSLVTMAVPADDTPAQDADRDAGGGASAESGIGAEVSSSPLPQLDNYEQGQPIAHAFILAGPMSVGETRTVLSYTLMRVHDRNADEFVRFSHISFDRDTGVYSYAIDTSNLAAGEYRLLIGSSDGTISDRMDLTILAGDESSP